MQSTEQASSRHGALDGAHDVQNSLRRSCPLQLHPRHDVLVTSDLLLSSAPPQRIDSVAVIVGMMSPAAVPARGSSMIASPRATRDPTSANLGLPLTASDLADTIAGLTLADAPEQSSTANRSHATLNVDSDSSQTISTSKRLSLSPHLLRLHCIRHVKRLISSTVQRGPRLPPSWALVKPTCSRLAKRSATPTKPSN